MYLNQEVIKSHYGISTGKPDNKYHISLDNKKFYQLGEGLLICLDNFVPFSSLPVPFFKKRLDLIEFIYFLSGDAFYSIDISPGVKKKMEIHSGTSTAIFNSRIIGSCHVNRSIEVQSLYVYMTPAMISSLCGNYTQDIVSRLKSRVIRGNGYADPEGMEPEIESIVHRIFNCELEEPAKQIFIKGKVLELLACEIQKLHGNNRLKAGFSADDIRQLELAKNIMMTNMVSPPSIEELARMVGLNPKKIKTGFQALYKTTVFGFLRSYRMEQAMLMIERDTVSVTQAGSAVGYTNISHFSAAFKSHFGIRPGEYLKSRKRRYKAVS